MKNVFTLFSLALSASASSPAAAALDACQVAIAKSINENEGLHEILGDVNAEDVTIASRDDAEQLASGLADNGQILAGLKNPAANAYQPGFHLIYVAVPSASSCEILAVGQGD